MEGGGARRCRHPSGRRCFVPPIARSAASSAPQDGRRRRCHQQQQQDLVGQEQQRHSSPAAPNSKRIPARAGACRRSKKRGSCQVLPQGAPSLPRRWGVVRTSTSRRKPRATRSFGSSAARDGRRGAPPQPRRLPASTLPARSPVEQGGAALRPIGPQRDALVPSEHEPASALGRHFRVASPRARSPARSAPPAVLYGIGRPSHPAAGRKWQTLCHELVLVIACEA